VQVEKILTKESRSNLAEDLEGLGGKQNRQQRSND
jgi:hypothetical protein